MEHNDSLSSNNKKCFNCGKVFKTIQHLENHKKRKTPCLIREVAPEQVNNPNRCIFCNKIFSKRENLTRHHKICKIKNGGMEILADKVKYEQEIRILKEKDAQKDELIQKLTERLEKLENSQYATTNNTINNVQNINITQNILINNYLNPAITHLITDPAQESLFLKAYKENLVQTPIALVPHIWFNPTIPENFSIYLVNKSTGELLTHDGTEWRTNNRETVSKELRNKAYDIVECILTSAPQIMSLVDPFIVYNMAKNKLDDDVLVYDINKINERLVDGRKLVKVLIKK